MALLNAMDSKDTILLEGLQGEVYTIKLGNDTPVRPRSAAGLAVLREEDRPACACRAGGPERPRSASPVLLAAAVGGGPAAHAGGHWQAAVGCGQVMAGQAGCYFDHLCRPAVLVLSAFWGALEAVWRGCVSGRPVVEGLERRFGAPSGTCLPNPHKGWPSSDAGQGDAGPRQPRPGDRRRLRHRPGGVQAAGPARSGLRRRAGRVRKGAGRRRGGAQGPGASHWRRQAAHQGPGRRCHGLRAGALGCPQTQRRGRQHAGARPAARRSSRPQHRSRRTARSTWSSPTLASGPVVRAGRLQGATAAHGIDTPWCPAALLLEADVAHFERVIAVNLLGVLHTLKAVLPAMVQRKRGCCVVTGSIGGFMGARRWTRHRCGLPE